MNKDDLRKLYDSVWDRTLSEDEIVCLNEEFMTAYNEDVFSKAMFCLAFGSNYFENNPKRINEILNWDLNDYDLGIVFDAIKYAGLTEHYIELLFEYINFEKFTSDWDCSCTCASNTISYYTYHFDKEELFIRLHEVFLNFVKTLNPGKLSDDEESFFRFIYKDLLYAKYGRKSHQMPFEVKEILNSDRIFNI